MKFSTSHTKLSVFWPVLTSGVSFWALPSHVWYIVQPCEIHCENFTAPNSLTTFVFSFRQLTSYWLKFSFLSWLPLPKINLNFHLNFEDFFYTLVRFYYLFYNASHDILLHWLYAERVKVFYNSEAWLRYQVWGDLSTEYGLIPFFLFLMQSLGSGETGFSVVRWLS